MHSSRTKIIIAKAGKPMARLAPISKPIHKKRLGLLITGRKLEPAIQWHLEIDLVHRHHRNHAAMV